MTTSAKLAGVVLFSSLAFASGSAAFGLGRAAQLSRRSPQGHHFDGRVKARRQLLHANADKACNLTLMLADAYSEADKTGARSRSGSI